MVETERKILRLPLFDYNENAAFYITICCQARIPLFEQPLAKEIALRWMHELEHKYRNIRLDEHIVMPDHIHMILMKMKTDEYPIGEIVSWYKTMTTNAYITEVKNRALQPFDKKLWQRNYYEHIIRNDLDLNEKRAYIQDNPRRWKEKTHL